MSRKIWVFVEGESEEYFIEHLIRRHLFTIRIEKDLSLFINNQDENLAFIDNCHCVDKIPHRINERYYQVEQSGSKKIFIICDVEELKCYSNRFNKIDSILETEIDKNEIRHVYFKPMIECIYWDYPQLIERIILLEYRKKHRTRTNPTINLQQNTNHCQFDLKINFKNHNVKFRESVFSNEFFSRIDFGNCVSTEINRAINFLTDIIEA